MPGKVAFVKAVSLIHVFLRPRPQAIEFCLLVQLYGDHHAIRHAFSADIVVADVFHIGHIVADWIIHALRRIIAIKQLLPGRIDLRLDFSVVLVQQFLEQVMILA